MDTFQRLQRMLPETVQHTMDALKGEIFELRLRAGQPVQIRHSTGERVVGERLTQAQVREITSALMDYSLYAREDELRQGFFTLSDGSRVGLCGRMTPDGSRMTDIGSACIRLSRDVTSCDNRIFQDIVGSERGLRSALILSPPGMGKTTTLRTLARQISRAGFIVGIADERHEIAACCNGVPSLDIGPCTDVIDGCPKRIAVGMLVRAVAPQVIIADEIGHSGDADALLDAVRCGVTVIATAHAGSFEEAFQRACLRPLIDGRLFSRAFLLGDRPGALKAVRALDERRRRHAVGIGTVRGHRERTVRKIAGVGSASQSGHTRRTDSGYPDAKGQHDQYA